MSIQLVRVSIRREEASRAPVDEHDVVVFENDDVLRLQVEMEDAPLVRMGERFAELRDDLERALERDRRCGPCPRVDPQESSETRPRDLAHRVDGSAIRLEIRIEDRDHAPVIEIAEHARLVDEGLECVGIFPQFGSQGLARGDATEVGIEDALDDPDRSFAEPLEDPVALGVTQARHGVRRVRALPTSPHPRAPGSTRESFRRRVAMFRVDRATTSAPCRTVGELRLPGVEATRCPFGSHSTGKRNLPHRADVRFPAIRAATIDPGREPEEERTHS